MANRTVRRTQHSLKSATFQWTECFWAGSYDDGALRDCIRSRVLISTRIKNHDYLSRGRLLLGAIMTAIPKCTNVATGFRNGVLCPRIFLLILEIMRMPKAPPCRLLIGACSTWFMTKLLGVLDCPLDH
ncbi:uncharacterized protein PGTG_18967 [Puccinia graminis f. sp. tritici CRL 75-36-700-3]|uniref:Uncharacterized protein n=1 Tax=Puccinia graminis f. sp. tritici (strain CRL 75-36-700-3 / race SCCL) TaxID=418459 RepID=E3L8S9_PUCGT|nr:uncharacterized protein PGTG_18967 [Puccinia graminis f. sp. tritici CRL 75-36-700-3]EFP92954.1 hypothetical protein PGTG_18967 [Puccinia graminis f. sp. tritici CRL 75-36-700-3]